MISPETNAKLTVKPQLKNDGFHAEILTDGSPEALSLFSQEYLAHLDRIALTTREQQNEPPQDNPDA